MKKQMLRTACYVRVSHEDQATKGDSIETQKQHLYNHINNNNNLTLVDFYCDEGISADKLNKRLDLQRLLNDVRDKKIDLIIFTKLDRWFRSVPKYYSIQEVLETNGASWQAILEDYETLTANGRFKVNIMLSVNQQERERTSERIKDVFKYKVSQGHAIVPKSSLPFPFTVEKIDGIKRVVKNKETEEMTNDMIQFFLQSQSVRRTMFYLNDKYNFYIHYESLSRLLKNTLLYGCYQENKNYCEGYVSKLEFDCIQEIIKNNIRVSKTERIYVFSGKVKCPACGSKLIGKTSTMKYKEKQYESVGYICNYHSYKQHKTIPKEFHMGNVSEKKLEKQLLRDLKEHLKKYILKKETIKENTTQKDNVKEISKLKSELDRLNRMYQKGRIQEDDYDKEYDLINNKIKKLEQTKVEKVDLSKFKKLLEIDFETQYKDSDRETRQHFWNTLVKEIVIDKNKQIVDIIFLD